MFQKRNKFRLFETSFNEIICFVYKLNFKNKKAKSITRRQLIFYEN